MVSVWAELKRRNVFKVGAAYAILAWLLLQITDVVLPTFEAPLWVAQTITFVLAIGFPVAVILAWAFDVTPQGIKAASDVRVSDAATQPVGQRLSYISQGLILLAVGFLVVDQYILERAVDAATSVAAGSSESTEQPVVQRFIAELGTSEPIGVTGLSSHMALSPDGSALVYAIQTNGESQLYFRELGELEARVLPETHGAHNPFFSPDGQWVGFFTRSTDRKLKKILTRGGSPRILADAPFGGGGSWGTDGTIIYGTLGESGRSLFRVPEDGGETELLLAADNEKGYARPHILPGNNAALINVRPGAGGQGYAGDGSIALLDLSTRQTRTLIEEAYLPRYTPTGHIVFVREGALWAVPFDVERLEIAGPEVPVVDGVQSDGFRGMSAYALSDDGLLLYIPGSDNVALSSRSLVWVDRTGQQEILPIPSRRQWIPRLSPDNQRVAVTIGEGEGWDVWIRDLRRGTSTRPTQGVGDTFGLAWTRDGERIVFHTDEDPGLLSTTADGSTGEFQRLTTSQREQFPIAFLPDSGQLAYVEDGMFYLLSMDEEKDSQALFQVSPRDAWASISPDGRWIAYESDETGRVEIYVRPLPDVESARFLVSNTGGRDPSWRPDGRELFYLNNGAMMAVSVEVEPDLTLGVPTLLFEDNFETEVRPAYDVSSDGQRFLMLKIFSERESGESQLIVVNNWFEELKRHALPFDND